MKKVYFSGSIRGGRVDASLYKRIIDYISSTDKVLTEHIGDKNINLNQQENYDMFIYKRDISWLRKSDLVIAECTSPSCSQVMIISTYILIIKRRIYIRLLIIYWVKKYYALNVRKVLL